MFAVSTDGGGLDERKKPLRGTAIAGWCVHHRDTRSRRKESQSAMDLPEDN
jgi:hypothetical protein